MVGQEVVAALREGRRVEEVLGVDGEKVRQARAKEFRDPQMYVRKVVAIPESGIW